MNKKRGADSSISHVLAKKTKWTSSDHVEQVASDGRAITSPADLVQAKQGEPPKRFIVKWLMNKDHPEAFAHIAANNLAVEIEARQVAAENPLQLTAVQFRDAVSRQFNLLNLRGGRKFTFLKMMLAHRDEDVPHDTIHIDMITRDWELEIKPILRKQPEHDLKIFFWVRLLGDNSQVLGLMSKSFMSSVKVEPNEKCWRADQANFGALKKRFDSKPESDILERNIHIKPQPFAQHPRGDDSLLFLDFNSGTDIRLWLSTETPFRDLDGRVFINANQFFFYHQAMIFSDHVRARAILQATDNMEIIQLSRSIVPYDDYTWSKYHEKTLYHANLYKFTRPISNKALELQDLLLSTGDRELVVALHFDSVMGIGMTKENAEERREVWGENLLGKALMQVRRQIRKDLSLVNYRSSRQSSRRPSYSPHSRRGSMSMSAGTQMGVENGKKPIPRGPAAWRLG